MSDKLKILMDSEELKKDCENLKEFNKMRDSKLFQILNEELDEFINNEDEYTEHEIFLLYRYYGKILSRLKGECE